MKLEHAAQRSVAESTDLSETGPSGAATSHQRWVVQPSQSTAGAGSNGIVGAMDSNSSSGVVGLLATAQRT